MYLQYLVVFTHVAAAGVLDELKLSSFIIPGQLYMFRAMFLPIIRST